MPKNKSARASAIESAGAEGEFSLTVSRALRILTTFSVERAELGVTELSRELVLSKTSVHRLMHALEKHQFLDQNPQTRKYRIGVEAFRVGNLFSNGHRLEQTAQALMQDLVGNTGFTSYISRLRHDSMVLTASVEGPGPIRYSIPVGQRLPVHSTATGKAALAQLDDSALEALLTRIRLPRRTARTITEPRKLKADLAAIRARGYSLNWEENTPGVGSVAAAICDRDRALMAVLSIGFATSQIEKAHLRKLGARVARTAAEIARRFVDEPVRRVA